MNRRRFLIQAPIATAMMHASLRAQQPDALVVRIDPENVLRSIPDDMMGLSYESTQLGDPTFFAPENLELIRIFRELSPTGVLRFGGNTSEFTYFKASEFVSAPAYTPRPTQPGKLIAITPQSLRNLRGFLDSAGWSCIYGLNLGTGTPVRAAEEAAAVAAALGPRLKYFQIGNEPNNYIRYKLRDADWNAEVYYRDWLPFAKAIVQKVPYAKIGGPDMGAERDWMVLFAQKAPHDLGAAWVELTDHFYAEGPPSSPASTMENLLQNGKILHEIAVMQEASRIASRPCRMTEVNSCYTGGKPGVSDVAGSALWAGDLTMRLLREGFSGVNFHGGSAEHIKASLGGTLPGDDISKRAASDSYYTPIAGSVASGFTTRPIFQGMALASRMAGGEMLHATTSNSNIGAYAVRRGNQVAAVVFNLSTEDVPLRLDPGHKYKDITKWTLAAPSLQSEAMTMHGPKPCDAACVLPVASAQLFQFG